MTLFTFCAPGDLIRILLIICLLASGKSSIIQSQYDLYVCLSRFVVNLCLTQKFARIAQLTYQLHLVLLSGKVKKYDVVSPHCSLRYELTVPFYHHLKTSNWSLIGCTQHDITFSTFSIPTPRFVCLLAFSYFQQAWQCQCLQLLRLYVDVVVRLLNGFYISLMLTHCLKYSSVIVTVETACHIISSTCFLVILLYVAKLYL